MTSNVQAAALKSLVDLLIKLRVLDWEEWPSLTYGPIKYVSNKSGDTLRITSERAWLRSKR